MALIYNSKRKKELNIESLSRLSYNQFCSLFSGFIDGDGSTFEKEIILCNYEKNNKCRDIFKIQKLLDWNYVFSTVRKNDIMIPKMTYNKELFQNLNISDFNEKCFHYFLGK